MFYVFHVCLPTLRLLQDSYTILSASDWISLNIATVGYDPSRYPAVLDMVLAFNSYWRVLLPVSGDLARGTTMEPHAVIYLS